MERVIIDGKDLWVEYRGRLLEGSLKSLVEFPALKAVKSNDWFEEDGLECDLSEPRLSAKQANISIGFFGSMRMRNRFIEDMSAPGYRTMYVESVGRTFRCRFISIGENAYKNGTSLNSIAVSIDAPLDGYGYSPPLSDVAASDDFRLDGVELTSYGIRILEGSLINLDEVSVKEPLLKAYQSIDGVIADVGFVSRRKSKDFTLNCLMRANSLNEFWRNHDALLYDLVKADARKVYVQARQAEYGCFFKSCSSTDFWIDNGRVWWRFALRLTSIDRGQYKTYGDFVLASETDGFISAEDDSKIVIGFI